REVANVTTIRTITATGSAIMTLFNSNGLLSGISHSKVVPTPAIIEDTPPAMLTRFQKKTASKAGVSPAPYTVYAYICTSRTVGKNVTSTNATIPSRIVKNFVMLSNCLSDASCLICFLTISYVTFVAAESRYEFPVVTIKAVAAANSMPPITIGMTVVVAINAIPGSISGKMEREANAISDIAGEISVIPISQPICAFLDDLPALDAASRWYMF